MYASGDHSVEANLGLKKGVERTGAEEATLTGTAALAKEEEAEEPIWSCGRFLGPCEAEG